MKIWYDITHFNAKNPTITLGTFDGLHLGHRRILDELIRVARETNGESVIFTFWPHPRMVVNPNDKNLKLLNTKFEKALVFKDSGIDHLIVYPFSKEFAQLTACEFINNILIKKLHTKNLVVGYDHQFGRDRQGDINHLRACAEGGNLKIFRVEALQNNGINISSTKIRKALESGDLDTANSYLGYPYFFRGRVVKGRQIGRTIGFPTANFKIDEETKLLPCSGVYVAEIDIEEKVHWGMLNIGWRPTFDKGEQISIEVNVFDFSGNLYGKELIVRFLKRLRNEEKFSSVSKLIEQLHIDEKSAREFLGLL